MHIFGREAPRYSAEYHGAFLRGNDLMLLMQRLGSGAPRVHLDIHTDDLDAEVARLERLGAERVQKVQTWWVMRDPAGLLPVDPGSGRRIVDAEQGGLVRDLPVQHVVGLQFEVEELAHVPLVGAAPPVLVHRGGEAGTAEQWRDVIEDGPQQGMVRRVLRENDGNVEVYLLQPPGFSIGLLIGA